METYIVNGKEVQYDTFDLDNMERMEEEAKQLQSGVQELQSRRADGESAMKLLREQADLFLDFFDNVLGDGSAHSIFGDRVNILAIANGYKEFTEAVAAQQSKLAQDIGQPKLNREQRRARR